MSNLHKEKYIYKTTLRRIFLKKKENIPNEFVDKIKKGNLYLNIYFLKIASFMR